jgi:hypothetical protein
MEYRGWPAPAAKNPAGAHGPGHEQISRRQVAVPAEGVIRPVHEAMAGAGMDFGWDRYFGSVKGYDSSADGDTLSLPFNGTAQVAHISAMGDRARDARFIWAGRRNEGGAGGGPGAMSDAVCRLL